MKIQNYFSIISSLMVLDEYMKRDADEWRKLLGTDDNDLDVITRIQDIEERRARNKALIKEIENMEV